MAKEQEAVHPYTTAGLRRTESYNALVRLQARNADLMWCIARLRKEVHNGAPLDHLLSRALDQKRAIVQQIIALELALGLLEKVGNE